MVLLGHASNSNYLKLKPSKTLLWYVYTQWLRKIHSATNDIGEQHNTSYLLVMDGVYHSASRTSGLLN